MAKNKRKSIFDDGYNGEYLGNIFGWKISLIGLAAIILLLVLCLYLYQTRGIDPNFYLDQQNQSILPTMDSIQQERK